MKHIIYTLLTACIVTSCADVPEEYSDTSTSEKLSSTNDLQYIDIANAKSLYISSSTGSGRTSSKGYGGKAENKIFKITDDGGVEEVEYKDGDNKTHTIINSPIAIDVVDENYIVFSFGSGVRSINSCYLTNKETGTVYVLGDNESASKSKCPLPQESRDKKILTDGKGNLYYRYYGGEVNHLLHHNNDNINFPYHLKILLQRNIQMIMKVLKILLLTLKETLHIILYLLQTVKCFGLGLMEKLNIMIQM